MANTESTCIPFSSLCLRLGNLKIEVHCMSSNQLG